MTVNVSVTITGSYPNYVVAFSDGGTEVVPYGQTQIINYTFAPGTTGFTFDGVDDLTKDPSKSEDFLTYGQTPSQLTVEVVNCDPQETHFDYRVGFLDSQGRKFDSADPEVICEPE